MTKKALVWVATGILAVLAAATGLITLNIEKGKVEAHITYSVEKVEPVIEDRGEINVEEIPTVEEVDGGMFQDIDTGLSAVTTDQYTDLGWAEVYDTSSPEAFRDATLGKCIYANNYFGAQCVSMARVFWWGYADRDVSTCGTGMAKGMMKCADQNAGDDFEVHWGSEGIQAGDWPVWETGTYGHVGMALGPVTNGYVALLGENQGGRPCEKGGAAANIINLNVKGVIGYYRPKAYIKPAPTPTPEPTPTPDPDDIAYKIQKGDTLGAILRKLGYKGNDLFGDSGVAQKVATDNGIKDRGLIYPNRVIYINPVYIK